MDSQKNLVWIDAVLIDKRELRFTPAGVAVFEGDFHHLSQQSEAGAMRKVELDFSALAFSDIAVRLDRVSVGQALCLRGFLATRSIRNSKLTIHITEFKD